MLFYSGCSGIGFNQSEHFPAPRAPLASRALACEQAHIGAQARAA